MVFAFCATCSKYAEEYFTTSPTQNSYLSYLHPSAFKEIVDVVDCLHFTKDGWVEAVIDMLAPGWPIALGGLGDDLTPRCPLHEPGKCSWNVFGHFGKSGGKVLFACKPK